VQTFGDRHKELVSSRMPKAVVDGLEVIEVDEKNGEWLLVTRLTSESVLHAILEELPVREVRKRVVEGLVSQVLLIACEGRGHRVEQLHDLAELVATADGDAMR
jgi:hypothetical protein